MLRNKLLKIIFDSQYKNSFDTFKQFKLYKTDKPRNSQLSN